MLGFSPIASQPIGATPTITSLSDATAAGASLNAANSIQAGAATGVVGGVASGADITGSATISPGAATAQESGTTTPPGTPYFSPSRTVNFGGGTNRVNFDGGTNRVNF